MQIKIIGSKKTENIKEVEAFLVAYNPEMIISPILAGSFLSMRTTCLAHATCMVTTDTSLDNTNYQTRYYYLEAVSYLVVRPITQEHVRDIKNALNEDTNLQHTIMYKETVTI